MKSLNKYLSEKLIINKNYKSLENISDFLSQYDILDDDSISSSYISFSIPCKENTYDNIFDIITKNSEKISYDKSLELYSKTPQPILRTSNNEDEMFEIMSNINLNIFDDPILIKIRTIKFKNSVTIKIKLSFINYVAASNIHDVKENYALSYENFVDIVNYILENSKNKHNKYKNKIKKLKNKIENIEKTFKKS